MQFKFRPIRNVFRTISANSSFCLQSYPEEISLATFRQVYLNSREVSYFPWQNNYSNLNPCHIRPKFFLGNKLFENLLLAKYLIPVHVAWQHDDFFASLRFSPFSTYAKFSEDLPLFTLWYAHVLEVKKY